MVCCVSNTKKQIDNLSDKCHILIVTNCKYTYKKKESYELDNFHSDEPEFQKKRISFGNEQPMLLCLISTLEIFFCVFMAENNFVKVLIQTL